MKKLIAALITVLILYVIYHDITRGTLPDKHDENLAVPVSSTNVEIPYIEMVVKPGNTVLSIVEKNSEHPLSVSISKVITDFQRLNEGKKPEEIQIGQSYKFPTYEQME